MENTNILKTALGVGVLGTAAVALGYYYFNEDDLEVPTEDKKENLSTEVVENAINNITKDVIDKIAPNKTTMKSFWAETYKSMTSDTKDESIEENNQIISS